MKIGRMRNDAKIQQNTPSRDASGGEVASWSDFLALWWCELIAVRGGETFRGRAVHASADNLAMGRYVAGVTPKMRLVLGTRTFDILWPRDPDGRGIELHLELKERL